ncbi:MAG: hypothetical protein BWK80_31345 [Desulfobacteraceae bacterium IS3]|nr:MAG: hypothetical protein BWK80_31345 [Desulfobacteraceae bacterium IS3]
MQGGQSAACPPYGLTAKFRKVPAKFRRVLKYIFAELCDLLCGTLRFKKSSNVKADTLRFVHYISVYIRGWEISLRTEKRRASQMLYNNCGGHREKNSSLIRRAQFSILNSQFSIALVYPNTYHVGMSNLGFHAVYALLNETEGVACERAFLPDEAETGVIRTIETGSLLSEFDIIAFSISYENDYSNLLTIFEKAKLPPLASERNIVSGRGCPLVIAGGVACFLNPEPIAPFIDCFLIGEAECLIPRFFECLSPFLSFYKKDYKKAGRDKAVERKTLLKALAQNVPGAYIPEFYHTVYDKDGAIRQVELLEDVPAKVQRLFVKDLSLTPTCSSILTPDTAFDNTFLIEVSRGCVHGCRFCSAGYVYRPPRFRPVSLLKECIQKGAANTDRIGLTGAAVSDLPGLAQLCSDAENVRISFSSLRADALTPELVSVLKSNAVKTATIAPEAGSERMRRIISKGITEDDILKAVEMLTAGGIPNLKLYFMIGLPQETPDDVEAIADLCKKIKSCFLESSRAKHRIGQITVNLNAFIPKPFTPFQWAGADDVPTLKRKITQVKNALKRVANVRVHADIPRHSQISVMLSRGDRRMSEMLLSAHHNNGNWAKTLKEGSAQTHGVRLLPHREIAPDECLPWDIIAHGVSKSFLEREYQRAKQEKTSPPCRMNECGLCGVCKDTPAEDTPAAIFATDGHDSS